MIREELIVDVFRDEAVLIRRVIDGGVDPVAAAAVSAVAFSSTELSRAQWKPGAGLWVRTASGDSCPLPERAWARYFGPEGNDRTGTGKRDG